jgi:methylglutaconyl-CoA hydratase
VPKTRNKFSRIIFESVLYVLIQDAFFWLFPFVCPVADVGIIHHLCSMIQLHIENRIATLILDRPEKRNALDDRMAGAILGHLEALKDDDTCKVLVIKAHGEAFCAGADLEYLQKLQNNSFDDNHADSRALMSMFRSLHNFPKTTIAQVEGPALAGGCGLAGLCDFCFATPDAKFGYTEVKIGFIPAIVSVFLGPRIGENQARKMLLTGDIYTASQAKDMHLVTEVLERAEIGPYIASFASRMVTQVSGESIWLTKELLRNMKGKTLDEQLDMAAYANAEARGTKDCKSGIQAFLNKEKITWN